MRILRRRSKKGAGKIKKIKLDNHNEFFKDMQLVPHGTVQGYFHDL